MTKITKFDRSNLSMMRTDLEAAIKKIAADYGVSVKLGTFRFGPNEFHCKLTSNVTTTEAIRQNMSNDNVALAMYGLAIGRKVNINGNMYEIVGYNPGRPKNDVSVKRLSDGRVQITNHTNCVRCLVN